MVDEATWSIERHGAWVNTVHLRCTVHAAIWSTQQCGLWGNTSISHAMDIFIYEIEGGRDNKFLLIRLCTKTVCYESDSIQD